MSDFLVSNLPATYGPDYYVTGKQLMVPLSSTWMLNVTSLQTTNKSLCTLDLSKTVKLSAIRIDDSNLVNFKPPVANTNFLSAFNLKTYSVELTGSSYQVITLYNCNELRDLNLARVNNLALLNVVNCAKLSSIQFDPAGRTFNSSVSNIYINLYNTNLNSTSISSFYASLSAGYYLGNQPYVNTYVTLCNPITGDSALYGIVSNLPGMNISVSICSIPVSGSSTDLLFATKL